MNYAPKRGVSSALEPLLEAVQPIYESEAQNLMAKEKDILDAFRREMGDQDVEAAIELYLQRAKERVDQQLQKDMDRSIERFDKPDKIKSPWDTIARENV